MNPKKFRNSAGKPSETAETVAACCSTRHHHWWRMGSHATADKGNKTVDRERLLLLCLPTLSVKVTATCNKEKNAQTVDFRFLFLCFSDLSLSFQIHFTTDPSLVSVFLPFASGGRRLPGWTAERGVLQLGWLQAVVLVVCCWEDRRRRCCQGGSFCVVGSVGAGGTAGGGELVRCGRWRCNGGWLLWVKKKSKSGERRG